jgi:hypothetical protein
MEIMDHGTRTESPRLNETMAGDTLCLVEGRPYAAELSGPIAIEVLDGACWATLEGEGRDHAMAGGERCELRGEGMLVIEALTPFTHLRIVGPGTRIISGKRP